MDSIKRAVRRSLRVGGWGGGVSVEQGRQNALDRRQL